MGWDCTENERQGKEQEMTSFGEYFDNQRIRLEKAMQNKNAQLNNEWRERYEERERQERTRKLSESTG